MGERAREKKGGKIHRNVLELRGDWGGWAHARTRTHPAKSMYSAYDLTTLALQAGSAQMASFSFTVKGCDIWFIPCSLRSECAPLC